MLDTKTTSGDVHIADPAHHVFTILDQKFSTSLPPTYTLCNS